jgi:hypothetical protein
MTPKLDHARRHGRRWRTCLTPPMTAEGGDKGSTPSDLPRFQRPDRLPRSCPGR